MTSSLKKVATLPKGIDGTLQHKWLSGELIVYI